MTPLALFGPSLRGLRARAGSSLVILGVAVVAVSAAVAGPVYYNEAQTSILRDSVASTPVIGRALEVVQSGPVSQGSASLGSVVSGMTGGFGRLFQPEVEAVEATAFDRADQEVIGLVARTNVCSHVRITGACPGRSGQVIISDSLAKINGWKIGQSVTFDPWGPLTITGVYAPPAHIGDYWVDRASNYFPYEDPAALGGGPAYDAMFTGPATLRSAPPTAQGNLVVDLLLNQAAVGESDVQPLQDGVSSIVNSDDLRAIQAVATSSIPNTMSTIKSAWSSLAVPLVVITLELLILAWLVLFLLVGDAVNARGPDVALAKLRGFGEWRTATFGLSEPFLIVLLALPIGCAGGWATASVLGHVLLRHGTPSGFPVLAIATAVAATAAGIVAIILAATRTLRRPVLDQWRRAEGIPGGRPWVLDTLLLTGAAAGLADLTLSGQINSAHHSALSLAVPGLLGLGVAVVASRLLPLACRSLAATRAGAGTAAFLAFRHTARRPGGARTTILLATSFTIATFAVSAWAVERSNYSAAAGLSVGAPALLTVQTPEGQDLGSLVARADPSGHNAAAVDAFTGSGTTTLAVDVSRWTSVASWPDGTRGRASRIARLLDPPTAPPLSINGDSLRVNLSVAQLSPPGTTMILNVETPTGQGVTPVELGNLPVSGDVVLSAPLAACPCSVQDLTAVPNPSLGGSERFTGRVTVKSIEVHDSAGWHRVDSALSTRGTWRGAGPGSQGERIGPSFDGLAWSWQLSGNDDATAAYANTPPVIPALAPIATAGRTGNITASGLDGHDLPVDVVAVAKAVPGLPTGGVVVDRRFAETAAGGNIAQAAQQVWIADNTNARGITQRLRREGVQVLSTQTQQDAAAAFRRAGPGLAGVLFLAEAAAAALIAAAGAILGLAVSARRRRYELASLEVVGIGTPTLSRSLVLEQVIVLGFGVIVGIGTGLAADALVLRVLPEFTPAPPVSTLSYTPPAALLTAVLAISVAVIIAVAAGAGAILVRGTRLSQLREGAQ